MELVVELVRNREGEAEARREDVGVEPIEVAIITRIMTTLNSMEILAMVRPEEGAMAETLVEVTMVGGTTITRVVGDTTQTRVMGDTTPTRVDTININYRHSFAMRVISGAMVDIEVEMGTKVEAISEAMVDRGMELDTRPTLTLVMAGVALTTATRSAITAVAALTMYMVLGIGNNIAALLCPVLCVEAHTISDVALTTKKGRIRTSRAR